MQKVKTDYTQAKLNERDMAMLEFAEKVTIQPRVVQQADIDRLRQVGFSDKAVVDLVYVIAWFNFIDRVADALGVQPNPWNSDE